MAITRIKNNQVTDANIIAYAKLVNGTITGNLFASNITTTSDVTIGGNLTVLGTSLYSTIASTNTYINDPLIVLNNAFSGANNRDLGFVFNRGTSPNQALYWDESSTEFRMIQTTETGTTVGDIAAPTSYSTLHIGNLTLEYTANVTNLNATGLINTSGNVLATVHSGGQVSVTGLINTAGNVLAATYSGGSVSVTGLINTAGNVLSTGLRVFGNTTLGLTGAISGSWTTVIGNITQSTSGGTVYFNTAGNVMASIGQFGSINSTGFINTSGNVSASTGVFGAINSTGYINTSANISTAQLNAGQINTTGNVLAAAGTFNALTVNGVINASGNILSTGAIHNYLDVNGNVDLGLAGAISGSWVNIIGNITQSTSGGVVYINTAGNVLAAQGSFGSINSTGYINTSGNISTAQLNAGQINTTGNVLAATGVFNAINSAGYINAAGNISTPQLNAGQINTTGNVLATAGTFNALNVNGIINASGNILGATGTLSTLLVNSTTNATSADGASGALQVDGGASIAKDVWIGGNLYVSNILSTSYTVLSITDPLLYLTASNTFPYTYDIGLYSQFVGGAANSYAHTGVVRDATDGVWKFFSNSVTEPLTTITFDAATIYDGIKAGNLTLTDTTAATSTTTGALIVGGGIGADGAIFGTQFNTTGNVLSTGLSVFGNTTLGLTGAISGSWTTVIGNITQSTSGGAVYINTSGNVMAAQGSFGSINSTGYINTSGNISTAQLNAGQINTTGNVLSTGGVFNALTVNGVINATGNILSTGAILNRLNVNGNTSLGLTGAISGSWTTVIGNITQTSSGGAVYINTTGNVLAATGVFGAINSTGYINTSGNISTAQLNAGQINTTGNVLASTVRGSFLTASTIAVGNISAVTIGNSGATVTGTTGAFSGNVIGGLAQFAAINATPVGNATASTGSFTTLRASEGIWANSATASTSTTTGAIVVAGGIGIGSTAWIANGAVINSSQGVTATNKFIVRGADPALLVVDSANSSVIINGLGNVSPQAGTSAKFGGTGAILVPVGSTAQRPGTAGNVDVAGMLRFNSSINNLEYYDGTQWTTPGSSYTVIGADGFTGNGVAVAFTLSSSATTNGTLVAINGVLQAPTTAYSISGTTLTFTEAPADGDFIDVRKLTTSSQVTQLASGFNIFDVNTSFANIGTGSTGTTIRVAIDNGGNINIVNGSKLTYDSANINVASTNLLLLDSFGANVYTSAKYIISVKTAVGGNVQAMESLVTTNGLNAWVTTYGVINNGNSQGTLAANVSAGVCSLWWVPNSGTVQSNIKVMTTYIV